MSVPKWKRRPIGLDYVDNAINWKYYIKKPTPNSQKNLAYLETTVI